MDKTSNAEITDSASLDASVYAQCAREPIHIPGGIQPHGVLFSVDAHCHILQASANVAQLAHIAPEACLGRALSTVLGQHAAERASAGLKQLTRDGAAIHVGNVVLDGWTPDGPVAIVVHRHDGLLFVEVEPARDTADVFSTMYPLVRSFVSDVQSMHTVEQICQFAANEIARITGFGRTLVYQFDEEGNGNVLAESVEPGYPSYLKQHFPASDIPAQARELYRKNRIRLISNANYEAAPLVPALHPATGRPTDLTYASLRSVSPVHLQYMRNMGTLASMSMSILVDDKLWGLISCHHATPRLPPFEVRTACEHVAQIVSLQIEARETQAEAHYRLELRRMLSKLLSSMANTDSFVEALVSDASDLLGFTRSSGAAVIFEGRTSLIGVTPSAHSVTALVDWLDNQSEDVVMSDRASQDCPALADSPEVAGFLAVSISKIYRNYVIWFRREVVQTIEWAGDPRAKLTGLAASLSPRVSFDTWTDVVRGRSLPWRPAEREIALEFRAAVLGIVLRRAEEIAQLATELGRANHELEGFSYTVSHDLRAPLRHIVSFADLLKQMDGEKLSERGRGYLERIVTSARFGGRLVDDLLSFAQLGRAALRPHTVDVHALVHTVIQNDIDEQSSARVHWKVDALPRVEADHVFLHVAFANVMSNAVKFSAQREEPTIEVGAHDGVGELIGHVVYFVRDNGIGFDMRYVDKLFGVFQRLHVNEKFDGTGIGLANVRRIIERHGGKAWAEGAPDGGATFYMALPKQFRPESGVRRDTAATALARLAAGTGGAGHDIGQLIKRSEQDKK
ncbi:MULTISPECIES: ATP-binding protein [Caballeronia]|jgi:light-regulated signal transduction histidine kinase (bacteriophytochrome)|uniref:histidine kinase n=1 Tax=Caballeronia zhejiangensis TaxID=871203 RepID=A0A656QHZ6_9BURK|nr:MULTISPECIES: ATP-binding protein [Caballeronia]EKS69450.1 multi-sensor signal transduction histidine kinase [Burkholderia sp. SJ98]KDR29680.1 ATPase [Caballeronia zhejiangensis]MCG7401714.1 GAF domain-containing protein [Caballeronia zhejiangensis]MCI1045284.1 GAF domain-containing protein [Caballeronia zhejiangensis]MDR5767039.1 GAF domain-containing protein [Caballeronia sp. LZ028]